MTESDLPAQLHPVNQALAGTRESYRHLAERALGGRSVDPCCYPESQRRSGENHPTHRVIAQAPAPGQTLSIDLLPAQRMPSAPLCHLLEEGPPLSLPPLPR